MKKIVLLALFLTIVIAYSSARASLSGSDELGDKEFASALRGAIPFYSVTVTRATARNQRDDYRPLLEHQIRFVLSILNRVLGREDDSEVNFEPIIQESIRKYSQLKNNIESFDHTHQSFINYIKTKQFFNEHDDEKLKELLTLIMGNIEINDALSQVGIAFRPSRGNLSEKRGRTFLANIPGQMEIFVKNNLFSEEDKQRYDYWVVNEPKAREITVQYMQTYEDLSRQIITTGAGFEPLIGAFGIVAFNEMFFGKNAPIPQEHLLEYFNYVDLSRRYPKLIFHFNFILLGKGEFSESNIGSEEIFAAGLPAVQYQIYSARFPERGTPIQTLENRSMYVLNGDEIMSYRKLSYFQEHDESLKREFFYMFGEGTDKVGQSSSIADLLHTHVATETCYDLELAVRKTRNNYPDNLKIYIIPSNTLSFMPSLQRGNITFNLPSHGNIVIHPDPEESTPIYRRDTSIIQSGVSNSALSKKYASTIWKSVEHDIKVEFELDGSFYRISIVNIQSYLS